jgi:hypothetical protein
MSMQLCAGVGSGHPNLLTVKDDIHPNFLMGSRNAASAETAHQEDGTSAALDRCRRPARQRVGGEENYKKLWRSNSYGYCTVSLSNVGRPLFLFAGPISAAHWTTKMIVDQQTGKNSGPAQADYQNGSSAIPLFCIFGLFPKIF